MLKNGMYVRCPYDVEFPAYPRVFVSGQIVEIDAFKNTCRVKINDPFDTIEYFENLKSGVLEYPVSLVSRCYFFNNSLVVSDGRTYKVLGNRKNDDEFYTYFLQDIETKEMVKKHEIDIVAAYNNGFVNPATQMMRYEFQNPVWFFGRNIVSKNINLLNNSVFGFKELAGSKIYLLPHQINTIMRCLQDDPCRYMLADEVGMGKTIEAISILKVCMLNKSNQKILIVVPGTLEEQWKTELFFKFNISIGKNKNGHFVGITTFNDLSNEVANMKWDYVVIDEVHRTLKNSRLYDLIHTLSVNSKNIILLSATPVQNRKQEYLSLLKLLRPDRYDEITEKQFNELISKQNKIVQKTSLVLSDLDDYQDVIENCLANNADPTLSVDCNELYEEMYDDLSDICDELDDEKLLELFEKITINSDDFGVYDLKVLISYICSNYQIENNIIRNRRKMLDSDNYDERKLPSRVLNELPYVMNVNNELATYNSLIHFIDTELELNDTTISSVVKPLLNSFFSSPHAFLSAASKLSDKYDGMNEIIDNAKVWMSYEEYILDNIVEILDNPDEYKDYYSSRLIQIFNHIYDQCNDGKTVFFTDYQETFSFYNRALSKLYDEDEYACFGENIAKDDLELNAYRFQNEENCSFMLCDYTGGEGRNFQCADYLVHIDLPWDANMIEQRIGRLDRLERDAKRSNVYSIVPFAQNSFEESLFDFWNKGLNIFTHSLSGMEIIMSDINSEIHNAIIDNLKYGLSERIQNIIEKADLMRKEIRKEQSYDSASFMFKPMYSELNKLVSFYNKNENELFAKTMETWASLAGFKGQKGKSGVTTYFAGSFSAKSAVNSQFIPPRWKDYMKNEHNVFLDKIQSKYDEKIENEHIERAIRGTFIRSKALENDYLHFYAPGDAVFDSIVDNAINNCKGQSCAFEVKSNKNWSGFVFTWSVKPNDSILFDNDVSLLSLGPYRSFVTTDQIITVAAIDNPDGYSDESIVKEYKTISSLDLNEIKKYIKHLGERHGQSGIKLFKEMYPSDKWKTMVKESMASAQLKAKDEVKKKINIKGASAEMQRALSALNANAKYYNLSHEELIEIADKQKIILDALKGSTINLECVAFMRMVQKND